MDELQLRKIRREKRQRNREIGIAAVLVLVVFISTYGQSTFFGSDSWFFLALLQVNAILMLVIFYLAARNIIKLIAERRRKVFGSRLRTRLLISFVLLSLIPVLLMFLAANRVIITSIDYWFTSTVASSMESALKVGQSVYSTTSQRLSDRIVYINNEINILNNNPSTSPQEIENYLNRHIPLLNGNIFVLLEYQENVPRLEFVLPGGEDNSLLVQNIFQNTNWAHIQNTVYTGLYSAVTNDYAVAIKALDAAPGYILAVAEGVGKAAQFELEAISRGFEDYSYLKSLNTPFKLSFTLILGLLGLIMVFSAIFMAVRLSKELTAPIEALAKGTDKIAQGELDIFLEDKGKDELGQLVDSFNSMAKRMKMTNDNIKQANTVLAQRNIFIETILENIATGIFVLSPEGKILTINNAGATILNINPTMWENKNPENYFDAEKRLIFKGLLSYLRVNPDKVWKREVEVIIKKQYLKLFVTALTVPDFYRVHESTAEEEGLIIAVIEDITELAKAERVSAWREVAKRIAHEMKNPLTPIRLSAERLERKYNPTHENTTFTECTQLIVTEVERMQKMVQNFTKFAQLPVPTLEPLTIVPLVKESEQIFKASHTHILWELSLPSEEIPSLLLDKESFKQALINIYLNACEALSHKDDARIITEIIRVKELCRIIISDNGTILTEEQLSNIFEPYYSNKKDGTGLGLAIVQSIIKEHNAKIYARNNEQGGTSICIEIPIPKQ